jgi:hypothetical protein
MTFPVSLCLTAKDEEARLPTCLRSVTDLFADIVVVDTNSTDHTREIAAWLEARPEGQAEAAVVRARGCQARQKEPQPPA